MAKLASRIYEPSVSLWEGLRTSSACPARSWRARWCAAASARLSASAVRSSSSASRKLRSRTAERCCAKREGESLAAALALIHDSVNAVL